MYKKTIISLLKKILPWFLAVLLIIYMFYAYPPSQLLKAARYASLWQFLLLSIAYFVLLYFADCFSLAKTFQNYGFPLQIRDLIPPRGITYLVMNVNYGASQAGLSYYLNKKHGIPFMSALGIVTAMMLVDFFWVISLAFLGTFFQAIAIANFNLTIWIRTAMLIVGFVILINIIFWHMVRSDILKKHGLIKNLGNWLKSGKFFYAFVKSKPKDYAYMAILRLPVHIMIISSMYLLIRIFGANVQFTDVAGKIPLVHLVSTIPIVPGGLGSMQLAAVELLKNDITHPMITAGIINGGELLLAAVMLWLFVNAALKSLAGLYFLRKLPDYSFKGKS